MKKVFYLAPRVLAIAFVIFISLFALDVLGEPRWLLALAMHLIPSFVLVVLTVIAWKWEQLGGLLFLAAGLAALFLSSSSALIVSLPLFVIGGLFLGRRYLTKS